MRSAPRWLPVALAVPLCALFVGLGIWQLQQLSERRSDNEQREAAMAMPEYDLNSAGFPAASDVAGRRVVASGVWAPEHEIVVRGQAYLGTPGVTVLTPLVLDPDRALLVQRGWLPAADGLSADLGGAAPPGQAQPATIHGLALPGQIPSAIPVRRIRFSDGERPVLGTVDLAAADTLIPFDLAGFYVQVLPAEDGDRASGQPVPLPPPELTDGPHALYAFQWFGFAAIALAAAVFLPIAGRAGGAEPDVAAPGSR